MAVGDFNGDGRKDLAVANENTDNVSILLGVGNGTFGAATNFAAGDGPLSVVVGDFNGDGRKDLAVANINTDNVSILLGVGNGYLWGGDELCCGGMARARWRWGILMGMESRILAVAKSPSKYRQCFDSFGER